MLPQVFFESLYLTEFLPPLGACAEKAPGIWVDVGKIIKKSFKSQTIKGKKEEAKQSWAPSFRVRI